MGGRPHSHDASFGREIIAIGLAAYEDAMGRGPAWRNRISASLSLMPQARKRIDDIT
ncbi:hypothetical protein GCM10011363_45820 [Marivita lacus]|uniref:Uncharacterized protein n=1 Tax=Marivita lacus TaxID=1323742 RepID=A0ABQ1LJD8_9RHOB|nr:hypothetical protein GCM10011363_45820 [Marivita lacus]